MWATVIPGKTTALLAQARAQNVSFVARLRQNAQWVEEETWASAGGGPGGWRGRTESRVRLGKKGDGPRVRLVILAGEEEPIFLVTDQAVAELSAELAGLIYRYRWQVELFFKWLKCILGCRHWLAESPEGVALQVYSALICAQLLLLYGGQRPNKRAMEALRFYLMGWASLEELRAQFGLNEKNKN